MNKNLLFVTAFCMLFLGAIVSPLMFNTKQAEAFVCYGPNVVNCGAESKDSLIQMMNSQDQAGHTDIKAIYDKIGIYENDIRSARTVDGIIRKSDGAIIVNGQVVAIGTVNGQRGDHGIQGFHTPWIGLEWARPSANFSADQLHVWVYMHNNQFKYAIIKECGNPVLVPPLHVMPTNITIKKEVMNITKDPVWRKQNTASPTNSLGYLLTIQNTSEVTVREVVVKDALPPHVDLIPGTAVLRVNNNNEIKVPDQAVTGGDNLGTLAPGQIVYLRFAVRVKNDFPNGCTNLINTGISKAGNTAQVQDTATTQVCVAPIPVNPKEVPEQPKPVVPQAVPVPAQPVLPKAGPVEAAGGVMGTGALGYAGFLWRKSRRKLISTLLGK